MTVRTAALRAAIHDALVADTTLTSLLGDERVRRTAARRLRKAAPPEPDRKTEAAISISILSSAAAAIAAWGAKPGVLVRHPVGRCGDRRWHLVGPPLQARQGNSMTNDWTDIAAALLRLGAPLIGGALGGPLGATAGKYGGRVGCA